MQTFDYTKVMGGQNIHQRVWEAPKRMGGGVGGRGGGEGGGGRGVSVKTVVLANY